MRKFNKQTVLILTLAFVLIGGGIYWYLGREEQGMIFLRNSSIKKEGKDLGNNGGEVGQEDPRGQKSVTKGPSSSDPDSEDNLFSACVSDWKQISAISSEQFARLIQSGSFQLGNDCRELLKRHVADAQVLWFIDSCLGTSQVDSGNYPFEDCAARSESFRTFIIKHFHARLQQLEGHDLALQSVPVLKDILMTQIQGLKNLSESELRQSLEIAEEILLRDPSARNAYRAKLIGLLLQEAKFGADIDEYQYEGLLEDLRSLEGPPSLATLKNEILLAEREMEFQNLAMDLEENAVLQGILDEDIANLESLLRQTRDPQKRQELQMNLQDLVSRRAVLEQEEVNLVGQAEKIENMIESLSSRNEQSLQPGPEHLPFLRPLVKGDLDGLVEESQGYIAQYPNSLVGYYYLAQGLWRQGQHSAAMDVLRNAPIDPMKKTMLDTFHQSAQEEPSKFLERLLPASTP